LLHITEQFPKFGRKAIKFSCAGDLELPSTPSRNALGQKQTREVAVCFGQQLKFHHTANACDSFKGNTQLLRGIENMFRGKVGFLSLSLPYPKTADALG